MKRPASAPRTALHALEDGADAITYARRADPLPYELPGMLALAEQRITNAEYALQHYQTLLTRLYGELRYLERLARDSRVLAPRETAKLTDELVGRMLA